MKKIILILMLSHMLVLGAAKAEQPTFGRLFTTPSERSNLDYLRKVSKITSTEIAPEAPAEQSDFSEVMTSAEPSVINLQGYVKRNDGKKSTVWVNGEPLQENAETGEVQVGKLPQNSNQIPLRFKNTGKNLKLKAGEIYFPASSEFEKLRSSEAK